jgi:CFEM domain
MSRKIRGPALAMIVGLVSSVQSQLDSCGKLCISNLLSMGPSLGCPTPDAACLCGNVDFGYGIRDCAYQACGTSEAAAVISYASSFCGCTYITNHG